MCSIQAFRFLPVWAGLGLFCIGLVLFPLPANSGSWLVRIKEAATIPGDTVMLGDIAEPFPQLAPQQWERLSKTPLGPAPDPEKGVVVVNKRQLRAILERALGSVADACLLPSSIQVQRDGEVLMSAEIQRMIVEKMTPQVSRLEGEAEFRDFRLPDSVFLEDPGHSIEVELPSGVSPGRNSVRVVVKDGYKQTVRRLSGSFFLDLWQTVPCASRPLNRRERLQPTDVTFIRKNAAYLRKDVWDGRGGPWQMTRTVGEGQVIYASSLEVLPLVRRGDKVDLVFQGTSIRLRVPAEVQDDAGLGEMVLVENLQSRKRVQAKVVDSGTVVVQ